MCLQQLAKEWLNYYQPFVKESTYALYNCLITNYINPKLGKIQIGKVNNIILQNFINELFYQGGINHKCCQLLI